MPNTFIYLGSLKPGEEIARNLLDAGLRVAPDIAAADLIVTYIHGLQAYEDVFFDTEGVIAKAHAGATIVDLSPSTPALSKEVAAMATVSGQHYLEAPLVVNEVAKEHAYADSSTLSIFAAGEEDDFAKLKDVLSSIAADVVFLGPSGSAQIARCATTISASARMMSAAEALCLMRRFDPQCSVADAVAQRLDPLTRAIVDAARDNAWSSSYTVEAVNGEIEAALEAADEIGVVLPQAESAEYLARLMQIIDGAAFAAPALSLLYVDEAVGATHGLDWSRADNMAAPFDDGHDHAHGHGSDEFDEGDGYDDLGYGFGYGYSPN